MSTRLTYTSGDLGSDADTEFENRLAHARAHAEESAPHLVAGEDVAAGEVFERIDPSSDDAVASRAREATPELVARAVEAARSAAASSRRTPYPERCRLLRRVAAGIQER